MVKAQLCVNKAIHLVAFLKVFIVFSNNKNHLFHETEFGTMSTTRSVNVYHHEKSPDLYHYINIYCYPVKYVLNDLNMDLSIFSGVYI